MSTSLKHENIAHYPRLELIKNLNLLNNNIFSNLQCLQNFKNKTIIIVGEKNKNDIEEINFLNLKDNNLIIEYINSCKHNIIETIGKDKFIEIVYNYFM